MPRHPSPPKSWDDYLPELLDVLTELSASPYSPVYILGQPRATAYSLRHKFYQMTKELRTNYQKSQDTQEKFRRLCPGLSHEDLFRIQVSLRLQSNGVLADLEFRIIRIVVTSSASPSRAKLVTRGEPQVTAEDIIRAAQRSPTAEPLSGPVEPAESAESAEDKPVAYPFGRPSKDPSPSRDPSK